ncbi:MAG: DUF4160 domain-containing protein [Deltaproteobacteria bacterium]|nr:DUF4160 domain-containing protein [Deltaproteobacteria bacterium]
MPEVSRFFGMVIAMYFDDHPPPHFHVTHGDDRAQMRIDPPGLLNGALSPRALALVVEWAALHRSELLTNWDRVQARRAATRIEPLR